MIRALRRRRRRKLRDAAPDPAWESILMRRFVAYRRLPAEDRAELLGHTRVLLEEKRFEARVVISAQASLLLLHRDTDYYPNCLSILVYPDAYVVPVQYEAGGGLVVEEEVDHIGESWDTGSLIVSWKDVLRGASGNDRGCNVVLHEFAHQVDGETGDTDGVPRIDDPALRARWIRVFEREYDRLCDMADKRRRTFIDEYGASHPSEFFAVATEHFFMEPQTFSKRHAELYRVLADFWKQDPNTWNTPATKSAEDS
jgi:Mlc titration factor MtfA (ptsG expression regulator)